MICLSDVWEYDDLSDLWELMICLICGNNIMICLICGDLVICLICGSFFAGGKRVHSPARRSKRPADHRSSLARGLKDSAARYIYVDIYLYMS